MSRCENTDADQTYLSKHVVWSGNFSPFDIVAASLMKRLNSIGMEEGPLGVPFWELLELDIVGRMFTKGAAIVFVWRLA